MATAAIDIALWDLKAKLMDLPLVKALGQVHDDVAVYGSGGFSWSVLTTTSWPPNSGPGPTILAGDALSGCHLGPLDRRSVSSHPPASIIEVTTPGRLAPDRSSEEPHPPPDRPTPRRRWSRGRPDQTET